MDAVKFAYCERPLSSAYVVPHPARPNEDTFSICSLRTGALGRASFFGVFDGHNGSEVSSFLASQLHQYVEACATSDTGFTPALNRAFQLADSALEGATLNCPNAGSTATVALLSAHDIIVAHCGDSRALLCRGGKVCALTEDHRPSRPEERARILGSGGQILWNEGERVMGVLATTRGFGDRDLKQFGVTAEPEVKTIARSPDDEFLILATDGVFNVLSNEEVADVARRIVRRSAERGSQRPVAIRLAASAIARFSRDRNSRDDITVVVVDLASTGKRIPILPWEPCHGTASPKALQHGLCWTPTAGAGSSGMYLGADRGRGRDAGLQDAAAVLKARRADGSMGEEDGTAEGGLLAPVAVRRWLSVPVCWGGVGLQEGATGTYQQQAAWVNICTELPYTNVTCASPEAHGHVTGGAVTQSSGAGAAVKATGANNACSIMKSSGMSYDGMHEKVNGGTVPGGMGTRGADPPCDGNAIVRSSDEAATVCTTPDDLPVGQQDDVIPSRPVGHQLTEQSQPPLATAAKKFKCDTLWLPSCASRSSSPIPPLSPTHGTHTESQRQPCTTDLNVPYGSTEYMAVKGVGIFFATSPQSPSESVPDVPCPPASPTPLLPRRASEKPPPPPPAIAAMMDFDGADESTVVHSPPASVAPIVAEIPADSFVPGRDESSQNVITTGVTESPSAPVGWERDGDGLGQDPDEKPKIDISTAGSLAVPVVAGVGRELVHQSTLLRTTSRALEDMTSKPRNVGETPAQPLTQTKQKEGAEGLEEQRQDRQQRHPRQRHRSYTGTGMDSERSSFRTPRARSVLRGAARRFSCMGVDVNTTSGGRGGAGDVGGVGSRISGPGTGTDSGTFSCSTPGKGQSGRGFGVGAERRVRMHTVSAPANLAVNLEYLIASSPEQLKRPSHGHELMT